MRLCLINSASGWGGAERMFLELAAGFLADGAEVDFVTRPDTPMARRLPAGARPHALRFRGDLDLATAARLHRLFRVRRPAAVLCNFGRECWLAGWAALPLGVPVVHVRGVADARLGARSRFLYGRLVARVACVSNAVRDELLALGLPPERFRVIANGLDVPLPPADAVLAARERSGAAAGDFLVVYSGRLNRDKGVDLLPDVLASLRAQGAPARLLVVGEGELRAAVEARAVALGLAQHVVFTGFAEEPLPWVAAADAALVPSRWTEAFGLVALEALALGTPLVASRVGGLAEIVADGDSGLLVERDDVAAMAAALVRLWREPELRERLRRRGRERAAGFSRAAMIAAYTALVRELGGA